MNKRGWEDLVLLLEPLTNNEEKPKTKEGLPVFQSLAPTSSLYKRVLGVLANPVSRALISWAEHYMPAMDIPGKPVLVVVNWDQPLTGRGFYLRTNNHLKKVNQAFVTLDTSDFTLNNGSAEQIFPHEFGHVLMETLMGEEKQAHRLLSTRMHLTTSTTDEATGFAEGWGDHFQTLVSEYTQNTAAGQWWGFNPAPHAYWCCNIEDRLRLVGVRENRFVHPPFDVEPRTSLEEWYRDHITMASVQRDRLKTPNQMLASEGVMASFFYFLAPRVTHTADGVKETRELTNYFAKVLHTLKEMKAASKQERKSPNGDGVLPTPPPLLRSFLRIFGRLYPETKEHVYRTFLETTHYVTMDRSIPTLYQQLYWAGRRGQINLIKKFMVTWKEKTETLLKQALATDDPLPLYGPNLWLKSPLLQVGVGLWIEKPLAAWSFDLNAAEFFDLMTIPGMKDSTARRILAEREKNGQYTSLNDLYARNQLADDLIASINLMAASMIKNPTSRPDVPLF